MNEFFRSIASLFVAFFTLCGFISSPYDKPADNTGGGDPFITEDKNGCYYTYTTGSGITIKKIKAFDDTTVTDEKTVYSVGNDGIVSSIWAPEIHKIDDRWYIVACAVFDKNTVPKGTMPLAKEYTEHSDYYRYGFVLESDTDDIFGSYSFKGFLSPDGMNNIDGTYLKKDGKLYYVCSAYLDIAHQCISITEMENPYTLKGESVILSKPEYYWETKGWKVNEGPAVLYNNDDIYIVYSASGYSSGYYSLGMLTLKGDNVLSSKDWHKSPVRVHYHRPSKDIYNAGHCSFLYRDDGTYMVYHATADKDYSKTPRLTYIRKVEFIFNHPFFG
ncbi:MAG: family 43 glycosylhydrolase [Clostridia bacterium]|nr:family 43 glycosylhydrolase [Clostridia bacterium]